jgi:hypothetical protein
MEANLIKLAWGEGVSYLFILQKYLVEMMEKMVHQRFIHVKVGDAYYRTLITAASYFSRSEEAATILKECNEDPNLQTVEILY